MTLTLPNDLGLLPLARAFVDGACRKHGYDEGITHAVVLAVNEAVSNVIRHAHRDRPESAMRLECLFAPNGIEIRLIDEGEPFDLAAAPELDPGELRVGGRGIYLLRTLMDQLVCEPLGAHGNVLRMFKRRPGLDATSRP